MIPLTTPRAPDIGMNTGTRRTIIAIATEPSPCPPMPDPFYLQSYFPLPLVSQAHRLVSLRACTRARERLLLSAAAARLHMIRNFIKRIAYTVDTYSYCVLISYVRLHESYYQIDRTNKRHILKYVIQAHS